MASKPYASKIICSRHTTFKLIKKNIQELLFFFSKRIKFTLCFSKTRWIIHFKESTEDPNMYETDKMLASQLGWIPTTQKFLFLKSNWCLEWKNKFEASFNSFSIWIWVVIGIPLSWLQWMEGSKMKWKEWIEMIEVIWKDAWIYRDIKNLVYRVQTYQKIIFGLVEI